MTNSNKLYYADMPVFAISTGRSGSTLVQRLLNCHRMMVVWGEHFGFLNSIASAYSQMSKPNQKLFSRTAEENKAPLFLLPTLGDPSAAIEWANPWSLDEFRDQVRAFLYSYFAQRSNDEIRWGFKEIRYNNLHVLNMLRDLYPRGQFIFIKRDPIEVTRSKVFAFVKMEKWGQLSEEDKIEKIKIILKDVKNHYDLYNAFSINNPGKCFEVTYERLISDPKRIIADIMRFLELSTEDYDWNTSNEVMSKNISATKRDDETVGLIREVVQKIN